MKFLRKWREEQEEIELEIRSLEKKLESRM
jgi:hypothetical protein